MPNNVTAQAIYQSMKLTEDQLHEIDTKVERMSLDIQFIRNDISNSTPRTAEPPASSEEIRDIYPRRFNSTNDKCRKWKMFDHFFLVGMPQLSMREEDTELARKKKVEERELVTGFLNACTRTTVFRLIKELQTMGENVAEVKWNDIPKELEEKYFKELESLETISEVPLARCSNHWFSNYLLRERFSNAKKATFSKKVQSTDSSDETLSDLDAGECEEEAEGSSRSKGKSREVPFEEADRENFEEYQSSDYDLFVDGSIRNTRELNEYLETSSDENY